MGMYGAPYRGLTAEEVASPAYWPTAREKMMWMAEWEINANAWCQARGHGKLRPRRQDQAPEGDVVAAVHAAFRQLYEAKECISMVGASRVIVLPTTWVDGVVERKGVGGFRYSQMSDPITGTYVPVIERPYLFPYGFIVQAWVGDPQIGIPPTWSTGTKGLHCYAPGSNLAFRLPERALLDQGANIE